MGLKNLLTDFKAKGESKQLKEEVSACSSCQVIRCDTFMVKISGNYRKKQYYLKLLENNKNASDGCLQIFGTKETSVSGIPKFEISSSHNPVISENECPANSIKIELQNLTMVIETQTEEIQRNWIEILRHALTPPSKELQKRQFMHVVQQLPSASEQEGTTSTFKVMPSGYTAKLFRTDDPMTFEITDTKIQLKSSQGGFINKWDINYIKKFLFTKEKLQIITGKDENTNTSTNFEFNFIDGNDPRRMRKLLMSIMERDAENHKFRSSKNLSAFTLPSGSPESPKGHAPQSYFYESNYEEDAQLQHIIPSSDLYEEPPILQWNTHQVTRGTPAAFPGPFPQKFPQAPLPSLPPSYLNKKENQSSEGCSGSSNGNLLQQSSPFNKQAEDNLERYPGPINGDLYATASNKN